ncbi:PLP-dependent aminotransferase family protein [Winkia neuii]|uniref:MocR-like pyridoxine biosynthesis transcription factor PdxR n=1 Tax=Winkia TaxID=2692118 RepID=UPI00142F7BC6|nr:PLP-dependent aminotransferase family protein [Winkia sp. UMB1295B]MDK7185046.1 PLP-dependent aminotransferase family protein [Winkia sp. UMB1295B]NJJ16134.1 PLP-dependent aminotransferase family protein [Winkia neuii]
MGRSRIEVDLPLQLDRADSASLPSQIVGELRKAIGRGVLIAGDTMPSSRALAKSLRLSRGSVVAAYEQLAAEGYLEATRGGGTRVSTQLEDLHPTLAQAMPEKRAQQKVGGSPSLSLLPGIPFESSLQEAPWRAAWRSGAKLLDELDLPEVLAEHLRHLRSVVVSPQNIMVTSGARDGLATVLHTFRYLKGRPAKVGFESPGNRHLRTVVRLLGHEVVAVPIDDEGVMVRALEGLDLDLLVVTPSHQYPAGASMSASRRFAVLEWARTRRVVVVEDDYDSLLRHVSAPLPALASLDDPADPHVILLGTFSTLLTPRMSAGWLSAPKPLFQKMAKVRSGLGNPVSSITAQALAAYVSSGELARHTRRMRRLYKARSKTLRESLERVPGVRILAQASGLNAALTTSSYPEGALVSRCEEAGLRVRGLHDYWGEASWHVGLMVGVGALKEEEFQIAVDRLVQACSPRPK